MKTTVLSLALLLMASTAAIAQSRQSENLCGLKGVRLVIMFGRADAMDKAQQPAVLKLLEADAKAKFQKAGIPLLQFANEIEEAGSPQLIVTITLDKPNGFVYPLVTDMKLLQRVRLARDPSIEADVTTWQTYGVGAPEFTVEMIRSQIGDELDRFIKDYMAANPK
ncbi:MAG TPA: hypothetical protein VGC66_24230 [Pyrinomonadaceae bacterium]|jgi:hypothetical protein